MNQQNQIKIETIDALMDAQEKMREAAEILRDARNHAGGRIGELLYRYIIGHLEPLIDNNHEWLVKGQSIADIIDELKEGSPENEEDQDDCPVYDIESIFGPSPSSGDPEDPFSRVTPFLPR